MPSFIVEEHSYRKRRAGQRRGGREDEQRVMPSRKCLKPPLEVDLGVKVTRSTTHAMERTHMAGVVMVRAWSCVGDIGPDLLDAERAASSPTTR
jgi:hypothetical protein